MTGILYIDANQAFFYQGNIPNVLPIELLASGITRDLEVVNQESLDLLVKSFVETNKISPSEILIVLSGVYTFEKDFPEGINTQGATEEIQKFLSLVPFEESYSRIYQINTNSKIIAANKEFCEAFTSAFEKQRFNVLGIIPVTIAQLLIPALANNIDLKTFLEKFDNLKELSFSIEIKEKVVTREVPGTQKPPLRNKRTLILIGVFASLVLVLLILVVLNMMPQPKKTNVYLNKPLPIPSRTMLPSPTINLQLLEATPTGELNQAGNRIRGISTESVSQY